MCLRYRASKCECVCVCAAHNRNGVGAGVYSCEGTEGKVVVSSGSSLGNVSSLISLKQMLRMEELAVADFGEHFLATSCLVFMVGEES